MPNASTTQTSSASETTGTPIPLTYGYAWATGKRSAYYELLNTGDQVGDYWRAGMWLLGHGEWDGPIELWINDLLAWRGNVPAPPPNFKQIGSPIQWTKALDGGAAFAFNFHRGADSIIGSGLTTPSSSGPDQGLDLLWPLFPPAIQMLDYSRIAYYSLYRKQAIENQTNTHQNDPSQWTDIAPIGLWRALRCRLFDDQGNQTGHAFTTNPAWHFVDVLLRRKIFPDFGLDLALGPDPLPSAVQNRFDWGPISAAAAYFDEFLANGRRRFEGNYAFSAQTSLQAVLEQILLNCRSFASEYAGKIGLNCDMPRSSVFTFSRNHILPGSWNASDQVLTKSANRYVANFRDLLIPECSQIASIVGWTLTTVEPHPFETGDWMAIGGTSSPYDGQWQVLSVPDVINPGLADEIDPTTLVLVASGENPPASIGAVGGCGLLYSRFKERSPEFWHKANMLARGVIGLGIPRQREKTKQSLDFATCTWDQASRLTTYERDRLLGLDTTGANGQLASPYQTPPRVALRTSMFARDAYGNLACAVRPGDRVTIDTTANYPYAGDYEVLDPLSIFPPTCAAGGGAGAIALTPSENSGEIEFSLGPYNEDVFYDTSDPTQAGWPSVPGSDPGNSEEFTNIPLAAGQFAFVTGQQPSGSVAQLPSTGFPPANVFGWAGPAGFLYTQNDMNVVGLCAVGATLGLTLNYFDNSGDVWNGQTNFALLTWLSADVPAASGGLNWLNLTLDGGEEICFGQGTVAGDGSFTIELPAGFSTSKMFAVAYPHDGVGGNGNHAHWVGAYVDDAQVVHLNYKDGAGNVWHGNASVLVFAWKNNMGSVTTETLGGGTWMQCTLGTGQIFGVGCALGVADGSTLELPAAATNGQTLQAMVGTSGWDYPDNGHPAHGVNTCYLDADNVVHITFGDGLSSDDVWPGLADVFALYCSGAGAVPVVVNVTPLSATVAAGATQQFSAVVLNNANPNVTWAVDGINGGNVTVGTIDASGNYSAPTMGGGHAITATSVADGSASGSAAVTVTGSLILPTGSSVLTDALGNIIYVNGDVIYVL
jgi:hypothetical protein